ncbi:MAG: hypothetical protein HXX09_07565 [Bacteroidetes bacterium]|nr:hypothetical protein [Bacteroidota bacterium]
MKKDFLTKLLITILLLVCIVSSINAQKNSNYRILREGNNSNIYNRKVISITNQIQLDSLILELNKSDYSYRKQKDTVDFKKKFVIAYFAGSSNNGIKFDQIKIEKDILNIHIKVFSFSANCRNSKLLVSPFLLIEVDKQFLNLFNILEKTEFVECN